MVKHNNVVPNAHYHKHWQKRIKTWFDQPKQVEKRRRLRKEKCKRLGVKPKNKLEPVVMKQTQRYNMSTKFGRGFALEELKMVGLTKSRALQVGISVDSRRHVRSVEGRDMNVQRLKRYLESLVVFGKKSGSIKLKDNQAITIVPNAEASNYSQVDLRKVFPLEKRHASITPMKL